MSFGQTVAATKIELLKYKRSSKVATMVHKILDDKREVLLKRINEMIDSATKSRGEIWTPLQDVYRSVNEAYLTLGTETVDLVAQSTPASMEIDVDFNRIVDVSVPTLTVKEIHVASMPYGFADTNSSVDRAAKQIKTMLPQICKAAEYENCILSLANVLEKTQKLLNALEYVIIPQYESRIKFILATLEERDREDFVRLKKVKSMIEKRKA